MPRYIDADAFECISWKGIPEGYDDTFDSGVLYVADLIYDQPTVSTDEVRGSGFNKRADYPSLFTCSVCDFDCDDTYVCSTSNFKYCPSCGAKMEVSDDA